MDSSEAKAVLFRHLESSPGYDSILIWLRPYRGVQDRHLTEILHALLVVAPELNEPAAVDRSVVHAIWELCRTVRAWTCGPYEPMFNGRHFIAPAEKKRLDQWVGEIESITLKLLRGMSIDHAFYGLPWYIVDWGLGSQMTYMAPLLTEMLERGIGGKTTDDDLMNLCGALGSMGQAAQPALPLIRTVAETTTNPELKEIATEAHRTLS